MRPCPLSPASRRRSSTPSASSARDLRSTLAWMARQLGDTVQHLQATSQQEYDQASTLPSSFT